MLIKSLGVLQCLMVFTTLMKGLLLVKELIVSVVLVLFLLKINLHFGIFVRAPQFFLSQVFIS